MKVVDHFKQAKDKTLISFEVLPPLKGGYMEDIFKSLDPLMEFKPPFIDVTYHREEFVYNQRPSGYYEKTSIRKRPGTVGICSALMHHYKVDTVPHLICGGFSIEDTENALIDLRFLGMDNVLALRGDARKFDNKFIPEPNGHAYAIDLIKQMERMNRGLYLDKDIENGAKSNFCIGIAGYPEKHFESPNMDLDVAHTKAKVDAGADYIVTQMFFDTKKYIEYVKACRAAGIKVPIVPGIKPLTKQYQLNSIPRHFFVNMPDDLVKAVSKNPTKIRQIGMEWCIAQCQELKEFGVPALHFYTMGDSKTIYKICKAVS